MYVKKRLTTSIEHIEPSNAITEATIKLKRKAQFSSAKNLKLLLIYTHVHVWIEFE